MLNGARTKVVLLNGITTDTWSNEWREECLSRKPLVDHVLTMLGVSNRVRREKFYDEIRERHGKVQEERVRNAVSITWGLMKKERGSK